MRPLSGRFSICVGAISWPTEAVSVSTVEACALDLDHLLGSAHRQFKVQYRPRADGQHDAGLHHLLEAGLLRGNLVGAHLHFRENVASLPVGNAGVDNARVDVFRLDLGAGYHRAAGIHRRFRKA